MRAAALACVVAVGCTGGAAPAPRPSPLPVPVAPAPALAPIPPGLEAPAEVACTLRAARWPTELVEDASRAHHYLRLTPSGRPFAQLFSGAEARLTLPVAAKAGAGVVDVDANGVAVRGMIDAAELPLYPATAFVMAGVFVPNHERRLLWRSSKAGALTVATEALRYVRARSGEIAAERACGDVSLGAVILEDAAIDAALRPVLKTPAVQDQWLKPGVVPFAAMPGGAPVIDIESVERPEDTLLVHPARVLEADKDQRRVALRAFGGVVVGWVPQTRLRRLSRQYLDLSHDCETLLIHGPRTEGSFVRCEHELALVADVDGERRQVGVVRAGVAFEPGATRAGWTEIDFRDAGIARVEGASLLVRAADLARCAR